MPRSIAEIEADIRECPRQDLDALTKELEEAKAYYGDTPKEPAPAPQSGQTPA